MAMRCCWPSIRQAGRCARPASRQVIVFVPRGGRRLRARRRRQQPDAALGQRRHSGRDRDAAGFGVNAEIAADLAKSGQAASLGEYRWGGAAGTHFWIDPEEQLIGIYMVQILPHNGLEYGNTFKQLTYQAIAD